MAQTDAVFCTLFLFVRRDGFAETYADRPNQEATELRGGVSWLPLFDVVDRLPHC